MLIKKVHHVAYRCIDAKQTVEWYGKHLDMKFVLAIAEDEVPSTGQPDPYMHVFLDAGQGNILAFFELPTRAPMGRDQNTPAWVQQFDGVMKQDRFFFLLFFLYLVVFQEKRRVPHSWLCIRLLHMHQASLPPEISKLYEHLNSVLLLLLLSMGSYFMLFCMNRFVIIIRSFYSIAQN